MSLNLQQNLTLSRNRRFLSQLNWSEVGAVLFLALAAIGFHWKMLYEGLVFGAYDLWIHVTWLQHFFKELTEGILYPRWLAGTNFGYGSPTFVFYPPLVYYLGSALKAVGLSTEQAIIWLFILGLFGSSLSFYIYGRTRWGQMAALVGALLYMTAPYTAHVIYAKGALAETWSLIWFPLSLYMTDRAMAQPRWRIALGIFFAFVALTHLPGLLFCVMLWLPYTLHFLLSRSWKAVVMTIGAAALGWGIASFFLLPAILEQPLVDLERMRGAVGGFQANLLGTPIRNMFSLVADMEKIFLYQSFFAFCLAAIALFCFHRNGKKMREVGSWVALLIAVAFLTSYISAPIWQASLTLQQVQFPWRLMGLFSLGGASLGSLAVDGIMQHYGSIPISTRREGWQSRPGFKALLLLIVVGILLCNVGKIYKSYQAVPALHHPGIGQVNNLEHMQIALYDPYTDKLIDDAEYHPLINKGYPAADPVLGRPPISLVKGKAKLQVEQWGSYHRTLKGIVEETARIKVRTYYYPAWHLFVNHKPQKIEVASDGTIELKLEPGFSIVELHYLSTWPFKIGIGVSIFSILTLVFFSLRKTHVQLGLFKHPLT